MRRSTKWNVSHAFSVSSGVSATDLRDPLDRRVLGNDERVSPGADLRWLSRKARQSSAGAYVCSAAMVIGL